MVNVTVAEHEADQAANKQAISELKAMMDEQAENHANEIAAVKSAAEESGGEPFIVQVGWAATFVMFSFSLALVVLGRSGLR